MVIAFSSIGRRIIRIVDEQRNSRVLNKCPNVSISVRRHVAGMFPRQEAPVTARPDQAFANFAVVFKVAQMNDPARQNGFGTTLGAHGGFSQSVRRG
jgi:hypothetical protein